MVKVRYLYNIINDIPTIIPHLNDINLSSIHEISFSLYVKVEAFMLLPPRDTSRTLFSPDFLLESTYFCYKRQDRIKECWIKSVSWEYSCDKEYLEGFNKGKFSKYSLLLAETDLILIGWVI